jgi:hypothetical protein
MSSDRPNNADSVDCAADHVAAMELVEVVRWIPCATQLPDDERTVLMFWPGSNAAEPTWPGYRNAGEWFAVDGSVLSGNLLPTHWAEMPEGPMA